VGNKQRDYDLGEIERGLRAVAVAGGNTRLASRRLRDLHGLEIPASTLRRWIESVHADRYAEVRVEEAERVQKLAASEFEDLGRRCIAITHRGLDRLEKEMDELPLRDVPTAVRSVATAAGISQSNVQVTRERPVITRTTATISEAPEIIRRLQEMKLIEPEPVDAEVVENGNHKALPSGEAQETRHI
jgi:hypothetical protein